MGAPHKPHPSQVNACTAVAARACGALPVSSAAQPDTHQWIQMDPTPSALDDSCIIVLPCSEASSFLD